MVPFSLWISIDRVISCTTSTKCRVLSVGSVFDDFVLPCYCSSGKISHGEPRLPHHRIALPHDDVVGGFDGLDVARQVLVDLVCAVPADDDHLAGYSVGIDHCMSVTPPMSLTIQDSDQLIRLHRGPNLDAADTLDTILRL